MTEKQTHTVPKSVTSMVRGALPILADPRYARVACAVLLGLFVLLHPLTHLHTLSGEVHSHDWEEHHASHHGQVLLLPMPDGLVLSVEGVAHSHHDAVPLDITARLSPPQDDHRSLMGVFFPVTVPVPATLHISAGLSPRVDASTDASGPNSSRAPPAIHA